MIARSVLLVVVVCQAQATKPNLWCEIGEWTATSVVLGASFIIDNQPPLFKESLLGGTTNLSYHDQEAVKESWLIGASAGFVGGILLIPNNQGFFNETSYRNAKGFYEALAVTNLLTNSAKIIAGRKRPDYDDRVRLGKDTVDGRKAFWSGHAASSFGIATYASLHMFDHIGDNRQPIVLGAKTLVGLGLHTLAGYIAATRLIEHKHHPSDVIVGALAGSGTSLLFYGLHNRWWCKKPEKTGLRLELMPAAVRISLTIP